MITTTPAPVESARDWGRRVSADAPRWSEAKWRRINALLRIGLVR